MTAETSSQTATDTFGAKAATEEFFKLMKSSFEATFSNVEKVQSMNEKMLKDMVDRAKEMQQDGTKAIDEFITNANKGREEYRKAMEDGFKKIEEMMGGMK